MPNCKKSGGLDVDVTTYSGANGSAICKIGQRTDIMHIVEITNLRFFRATLTVVGTIGPGYRAVEFDSPNANDTTTNWSKPTAIGSSNSLSIQHVRLDNVGTGSENINTTVDINWPTLGKTENVTVDISVTA